LVHSVIFYYRFSFFVLVLVIVLVLVFVLVRFRSRISFSFRSHFSFNYRFRSSFSYRSRFHFNFRVIGVRVIDHDELMVRMMQSIEDMQHNCENRVFLVLFRCQYQHSLHKYWLC